VSRYPMCLRKRIPRVALTSVLLVGALSAGVVLRKPTDAFRPFVPQAPPQRALGDFDGDGRVDTALIQEGAGDRRISVLLSGSPEAVRLDVPVTGVIEGDVDHDGDLDLVAATPSGDVLIWLNDGHGRFTRQPPSRTHGLSGGPVIVQTAWANAVALGIRAPFVPPPARAKTIVGVRTVRPPTASLALDARSALLPTLRGPPPFLI
jgi:FG-GAP-like repeat